MVNRSYFNNDKCFCHSRLTAARQAKAGIQMMIRFLKESE
jgi:hypothetical protein